jgi:hypothetical protein
MFRVRGNRQSVGLLVETLETRFLPAAGLAAAVPIERPCLETPAFASAAPDALGAQAVAKSSAAERAESPGFDMERAARIIAGGFDKELRNDGKNIWGIEKLSLEKYGMSNYGHKRVFDISFDVQIKGYGFIKLQVFYATFPTQNGHTLFEIVATNVWVSGKRTSEFFLLEGAVHVALGVFTIDARLAGARQAAPAMTQASTADPVHDRHFEQALTPTQTQAPVVPNGRLAGHLMSATVDAVFADWGRW